MIIACPSCGKRYQIADTAIGPEGRKVRCAACGESWHATRPEPAPEPAAPIVHEPEPVPAPPPAARTPEPPIARPPHSWTHEPPLRRALEPEPAQPAPAPRFAAPSPGREGLRWAVAGIVAIGLIVLILMFRPGGFAGIDLGARLEPRHAGSVVRLSAQPPIWGEVIDGRTLLTVLGTAENPAPVPVRMPALRVEVLAADGRRLAAWQEKPGPALPPSGAIAFETTGFNVPDEAAKVRLAYATQP